jgi:hypothetical protein
MQSGSVYDHEFILRMHLRCCCPRQNGAALPEQTLTCASTQVLFGAIGDPNTIVIRAKARIEQGLLKLRKELGCLPASDR